MRRRDFIAGLGGAAAWPLSARAQQQALPRIGYLASGADGDNFRNDAAVFIRGLKEAGYVVGENVALEYRFAEGRNDRLSALARDLIGRVAVIVTYDTASALAAKAVTTTVPIVFFTGADPVKFGLVASFARPGGNITGTSFLANALGSKRLGLLRELVPTAATYGFLIDPSNPNATPETADMEAAASVLGGRLVIVEASSPHQIDAGFATLARQQVDALAVAGHVLFGLQSDQIAKLTLRQRLPTISYTREFVLAGGLISYAGSRAEAVRQQSIYTARILKGEMPADLPVQQITRFEMALNLKTARALGLAIPNTVLVSADEIIE